MKRHNKALFRTSHKARRTENANVRRLRCGVALERLSFLLLRQRRSRPSHSPFTSASTHATTFFYTPEARSNWVYDASSVALVCGLMLIEGLVACAAFVAPRPKALLVRCLLGLFIFAPWAYIWALGVMHAPGYVMYHILWVWLLALALVLGCLGSGIWRFLLWVRKEPPNNSLQRTRYARR